MFIHVKTDNPKTLNKIFNIITTSNQDIVSMELLFCIGYYAVFLILLNNLSNNSYHIYLQFVKHHFIY